MTNLQHMGARVAQRLGAISMLTLSLVMFSGAGICAAGVFHSTELAPAMGFVVGFIAFGIAGLGFFIRGGG